MQPSDEVTINIDDAGGSARTPAPGGAESPVVAVPAREQRDPAACDSAH